MLQTIRERAQGWIAWAIVILISVPFALWGIQSYLGVGSEPVVANVNGVEITQRELDRRYQDLRLRLREQLGAAYRPELFEDKKMRTQVLDSMIRDTLLQQVAYELGLRASDQELRGAILGNPAFQRDGRFDNAAYERTLELQGMSPPQYEEGLRQRIVGSQLERALMASELATDAELAQAVRLQSQQRNVSYVQLPKSGFVTEDPIPDEDIRAFYDANPARFETPERVKIQYLVLDASELGSTDAPSEDELRALYESEIERFSEPERRRVRHILITVSADADDAAQEAAKSRLDEIRTRIEGGEDFAAIAKELSEDPGSAGQGGDLGSIEAGIMDPAFDQAAFALEKDVLSQPVRTQFGYHLIQVTEIEGGGVKPLAAVLEQLVAEMTKRGSEGQFFDMAERLANLAYESPDSLAPAAEELGLELQTSDWVGRAGGEGILSNRKVIAAAFSDEVLRQGLNSDLIEPELNALQAVVLRVMEHEEASAKPLDEVRDEIVAVLRDQRAAEAALSAAQSMVQQLESGAALADAAGGHEVSEAGLIGRDAPDIPPAVADLTFSMARPAADVASYGSTSLANGDAVVVVVSNVVDGSSEGIGDAELARQRAGFKRTIAATYYDDLLADLQTRAKIERKPLDDESTE